MRDNLFPKTQTTSSNWVLVYYWRETQRLTPWVAPIIRGRVINRDKAKTSAFEPPYLKPVRPMHPIDLWDRASGEAIGGPDSTAREAYYISQDMLMLDHMTVKS
jgi:Phage major capsid protein E